MRILLSVLSLFLTLPLWGQNTKDLRVTLFCYSLRVEPGFNNAGGSLSLGSADFGIMNDELGPFGGEIWSYGAYFRMQSPDLPPIPGNLTVEIPFEDVNNNGFNDLFESVMGIQRTVTATGRFNTPVDDGKVEAVWKRDAGSTTGSCEITFVSKTFGRLPSTKHTFHVIEYIGRGRFQPGNSFQLSISITNSSNPTNILTSSIKVDRSASNPFNLLTLNQGFWTNEFHEEFVSSAEDINRDEDLKTNYFGTFGFTDGDLSTPEEDYIEWSFSFDDLNDSDGDGIPDFSDNAIPSGSVDSTLGIRRENKSALVTIQGQVGKRYSLEGTSSLGAGAAWSEQSSITLTNPAQTISIPTSQETGIYYRLKRQ